MFDRWFYSKKKVDREIKHMRDMSNMLFKEEDAIRDRDSVRADLYHGVGMGWLAAADHLQFELNH